MLKRLHILGALLLMAGTAMAQGLRVGGPLYAKDVSAAVRTPLMRFEQPRYARFNPQRAPIVKDAGEEQKEQLWWGYFEGEVANLIGFGSQRPETYWAAIEIPKTQKLAQGNEIKSVRFALAGVPVMKDLHLWIAEELPNNLDAVRLDIPVDMADVVNQGWTEVTLPAPYPVPNKSLYVGYTFTVTESTSESNYPVLIRYNGADIDGSFYIRTSESMTSWDGSYKSYGPIAMQVLLQGDFPKNSVEISPNFLDVFALPGGQAEATVTLYNRGTDKVSSIDYIIDEANTSSDEIHLEIEDFEGLNAEKTVRIPITADPVPGRTVRSITILSVNGEDNNLDATSDGYCVTLSRTVPRRTVVEEFTGTWCGWCPRGMTGLELVNEKFPEQAITIAVHSDDPMEIDYGVNAPSYPYAFVDRITAADPYYGISGADRGICDLVGERNQVLAEASVDLQAPVLNKSGNVTFKTDVCFSYTNKKSSYGLGYVLVADGLTGTGRDWRQSNYYAQYAADYAGNPDLKPWTEAGSYVPMTYDHVAIATKGMDGGIDNSIKASITDGDTITVSGSITLIGNTVLQSFENLSVVTVLFNKETGSIVNADIKPVTVAEDFAVNKMQVKSYGYVGIVKGTTGQVPVPVANYGKAGIHSIDYTVRAGVETSDTLHVELPQPITTLGIYQNVNFPVEAQPMTGSLNHTINIVGVNGQQNEATTGKSASGTIITILQESKRKTVIEEFTGTWCMWCPRGLAGLKRVRAEYPEDAVVMSVHGGSQTEPMLVSTFNNLISMVSGFPNALVNRYRTADPYMGEGSDGSFGMGALIEDENSQKVEAAIDLQQPTLDEETGVINFTTDVTFQLNRRAAPYLLSYVLVADGLHGDTDDWKQVNIYNYYAGAYDDDPYMKEVTEWPVYADITFNDVAVAGLGIPNGVTGSLKTTVEEGQVQSHSAKFTIKNNKLANMATELRVIALLYDKTRKCFINADEKKVVPLYASPVRDLRSSEGAEVIQRYGIDGKQLPKPTRGINLLRMSDGSVRKVMQQ